MTRTPVDRQLVKQLVDEVISEIGAETCKRLQEISRTCVTCFFFNEQVEVCKFKQANARPPARVIAFGCHNYLDKGEIPF
jgi:hypothetical protein